MHGCQCCEATFSGCLTTKRHRFNERLRAIVDAGRQVAMHIDEPIEQVDGPPYLLLLQSLARGNFLAGLRPLFLLRRRFHCNLPPLTATGIENLEFA